MSSNGVAVAIGGACLIIGAAAGYVTSGIRTRSAMDELVRENNELRHQLAKLTELFKNASGSIVEAIADVVSNPPRTLAQLEGRLKSHHLFPSQIVQIMDEVKRLGILKATV
jgi:hypothetical protein